MRHEAQANRLGEGHIDAAEAEADAVAATGNQREAESTTLATSGVIGPGHCLDSCG